MFASKVDPKVDPKVSSKVAPKVASKVSPKSSNKAVSMITSKAVPKAVYMVGTIPSGCLKGPPQIFQQGCIYCSPQGST